MRHLNDLFEHANPSATAIRSVSGLTLSYGDLAALATCNRECLRSRGIGVRDRVAILTPNGPQAALAFLTVAAASAAAPLNPAYSARELDFYFDDLKPGALVIPSGASGASGSPGMDTPAIEIAHRRGIDILALDPASGKISAQAPARLEPSRDGVPGPNDTALLLHTSGTTSRPKLVPLTQGNLSVSAQNIAQTLALVATDRCLNIMPLFHVHGLVGAVLSSLSAGASVICAPGLHANHFFDWLDHLGPTWYTAVPTMHQSIVARSDGRPHKLRFIRSSSAALPSPVMAALEQVFGVPVLESYGMTEASHQMASNPLPPARRKPGSVGRAAGPEIKIIGGEVCIRGVNVTPGYEANAEANAAAFSGDGWFRTGDQGYIDSDGYLFITGRIKELINRGGEKISPREIDDALLEHPDVEQAVAFAIPHAQLGEDIGVAVVARAGSRLTPSDVVVFAASRLVDFKIPRVVRIVDDVPKGPTGKIQRNGLAKALGVDAINDAINGAVDARRRARVAVTSPRNATEAGLHAIWSEVLGVSVFGTDEAFASLGGDSLAAGQVSTLITERFDVHIPFVTFRTTPTIGGMAGVIAQLERNGNKSVLEGLVLLRDSGAEAPLYCIAGHGGLLLQFAGLARYLDRPMFAFDPPKGGPQCIDTLAARHVEILTAHQPEGPYHLLGHCFGGFVAHEMACLLAERGAVVAKLILVESFNPQWMQRQSATMRARIRCRHFLRRVRFHTGRLLREPSTAAYVRQRFSLRQQDLAEDAAQAAYEKRILDGRTAAVEQRTANRASLDQYRARTYDGPVLIVGPSDPRAERFPAPLLGWQGLVIGPVEQVSISDNLQGMLEEPALAAVASAISGSKAGDVAQSRP